MIITDLPDIREADSCYNVVDYIIFSMDWAIQQRMRYHDAL